MWEPIELPKRIYVRVEARDKAGNVGFAQTPQAICGAAPDPTASVLDVKSEEDGPNIQQTSFKVEEDKK